MTIELAMIQRIAIWVLPLVFAITVHEVAHGWVAKKYGDNTASLLGRLTLNPIKHIDLMGSIIIPGILIAYGGFVFGWAKPVPVDPRNFKDPKNNMAVVAIAGPVSNLLMAIAWALVARVGVFLEAEMELEFISMPLINLGIAGISINLVLALINLLPIPPLDGSRIVSAILPNKLDIYYNRFAPFGLILLLILLWQGGISYLLSYPLFYAQQLFFTFAGM